MLQNEVEKERELQRESSRGSVRWNKEEQARVISRLCQQTHEWKLSACVISVSLLIHVCWVHCSFNISGNASTDVIAYGY